MSSNKIISHYDFHYPEELIEFLRQGNPVLLAKLEQDLKDKLVKVQNMDLDLDNLSDPELRIQVQVRKEKIKALKLAIKQFEIKTET